jgi:hypothetical protein
MGIFFRLLTLLFLSRRTARWVAAPLAVFALRRMHRWPAAQGAASLGYAVATRSPWAAMVAIGQVFRALRSSRRRLR